MACPGGTIWLVGAGNMGSAILRGWLASGIAPSRVVVIDPQADSLPDGVTRLDRPPSQFEAPDVLLLAVKPQTLDAVAPTLAPLVAEGTLLISILAGVEIASLRTRFPGLTHVVRVMPNLPVAIGKGVMALHASSPDVERRVLAEQLMRPLGMVEWIADEALFDAVTAVSGCGPAFVFRFIDALGKAGAALGLPPEQAARLAIGTVEGAALLAASSDESPAVLADRVASPGGSTREGLNVLDDGAALERLLARTLAAAEKRNAELAAAAR